MYYRFGHLTKSLVETAFSALSTNRSLCWVLKVPVQVLEHLDILGQFAIGCLTVSISLFDSSLQGFHLVASAAFEFLDGALLLGLEPFKLSFQISR